MNMNRQNTSFKETRWEIITKVTVLTCKMQDSLRLICCYLLTQEVVILMSEKLHCHKLTYRWQIALVHTFFICVRWHVEFTMGVFHLQEVEQCSCYSDQGVGKTTDESKLSKLFVVFKTIYLCNHW